MTADRSLGARLKGLRERAALSQEALASRSGVSVSLIAKLEQGQTSDPKVSTLRALARGLGVPVPRLIGDDEG